MSTRARRQRGVTLIEALLALLVMAVGLLGIAGVQATLRTNGDLSKQRAEASRLAQRAIESARSYISIGATASPSDRTYDSIISGSSTVTGDNASYTVALTVDSTPTVGMKRVTVEVSWTDRAGTTQTISVSSAITRVAPEFAGTLVAPPPGNPTRMPGGRHLGIPRSAVDQGDGTSGFTPPGEPTMRWVFNNATGAIQSICNPPPNCTDVNALLLHGFVAFATSTTQPTPADAEVPGPNLLGALEVEVSYTYPTPAGTVTCYEETGSQFIEYFCAVPVTGTDTPPRWSGRSQLSGLSLATSAADATDTRYRVCRYTPVRAHTAVSSTFPNQLHPLDYVDVSSALVQQNFLVIRAGDGTIAFSCPADDTGTPLVNSNTFDHQPL